MNISGNFNTETREIAIVKRILDMNNIEYLNVSKYEIADDGDVLVELRDGKRILIEVKEEAYDRFMKWGDLGIDYISAFQFKNSWVASLWSGLKKGNETNKQLIKAIDQTKSFKWGKVKYSKSDLWLFYVLDERSNVYYYSFFLGSNMTSEEIFNYLTENCFFAVNNKPTTQMSCNDNYNSACFFINHNDIFLKDLQIDIKEYIKSI